MARPIASPRDDYYQGKGTRPSATELGIGATTEEEDAIIKKLMLPASDLQVNAQKEFDKLNPKTQERINRLRKQMGWTEYPIRQQGVELFPLAHKRNSLEIANVDYSDIPNTRDLKIKDAINKYGKNKKGIYQDPKKLIEALKEA